MYLYIYIYIIYLYQKNNIYLYDKEYTKFVNEFLDKDEECNILMCKYICKIYKNDNWKNVYLYAYICLQEDLQLRLLYRSAFNLNDHYVLPFELASKIVKLLLYSMKTNKIQLHDDYVPFVNGWFIIYLVPLCDFDTTLKDQFDMYCCNRDELYIIIFVVYIIEKIILYHIMKMIMIQNVNSFIYYFIYLLNQFFIYLCIFIYTHFVKIFKKSL